MLLGNVIQPHTHAEAEESDDIETEYQIQSQINEDYPLDQLVTNHNCRSKAANQGFDEKIYYTSVV